MNNLAVIRRFVEETATALDVDPAVIPGVVLAVDEAVSNVIVHGYRGQQGTIEVEIAREGDALVVHLRDSAPPFDPTAVPAPDLTLPLEQRATGGLGMHLVRQIMDEVIHCVLPQGGNELTLIKKLKPPQVPVTTGVVKRET